MPAGAAGRRQRPRLPDRHRREPRVPTYGTILRKVEVDSTGNEAHHFGYTDDRSKIWAASLNTNRFFIFDVKSDPTSPKLIRTIDDVARITGRSGPHTPYAIPGRILVSMASGPDGTGPGGIAEFTNDGEFVATYKAPNHPYETVVKPEFNRMITSSWVSQKTFMSPLDTWDQKDFSNSLVVWDLKSRKMIQELKGDPIPLAARWALTPNATYGYTIGNAGNALWMFRMQQDGKFTYRKAANLGNCLPGDLRQSPEDKYLYVSCIGGSGDIVRLADLRGRVVMVSFVYTNGTTACPLLTRRIALVQSRIARAGLADRVVFLSVTVDPRRDTAPALRRYAERFGANRETWRFLRDLPDRLDATLAPWDEWTRRAPNGDIDHPARVYLIDPRGDVREIYGLSFFDERQAWIDVEALLRDAARP